jgi:hypothetical protein
MALISKMTGGTEAHSRRRRTMTMRTPFSSRIAAMPMAKHEGFLSLHIQSTGKSADLLDWRLFIHIKDDPPRKKIIIPN